MRIPAVVLLATALFVGAHSSALAQLALPSTYGHTWVQLPSLLYRVRVNADGVVSGSGSEIRVAHTDNSTACTKVLDVYAWLARSDRNNAELAKAPYVSERRSAGGLCSFNYGDGTIPIPFPWAAPARQAAALLYFRDQCKSPERTRGWSGILPYKPLELELSYNRVVMGLTSEVLLKDWETHVELTCEAVPCAPLALGQFENEQFAALPKAGEGRPYSAQLFAGGRNVNASASGLPHGMSLDHSGQLRGTPYGRGEHRISFQVTDGCPWNNATRRGTATLKVIDPVPPRVVSFAAEPKTLPPQGGEVTIGVTASDNLAVYAVAALVGQAGGPEAQVPLQLLAGTPANGEWKIKQVIPPNTGRSPISYTVKAVARDADDNSSPAIAPITLTVSPDQAPPQLKAVTLTPQTLPASGGEVTLSVRASDNVAVKSVSAVLTQPDGRQSSVQLPLVGGTPADGEWKTTWKMWANSGSAPLAYSVKVSLVDPSNHAVTTQPVSLSVSGASPSTGAPLPPAGAGQPAAPSQPSRGPQLLGFSATPTTLPPQGGEVTVVVRAADNTGVQSVTAIVAQPDGRQQPVPIPLVGGTAMNGEWRAKWTMPVNTGNAPVQVSFKAVVADRDNNAVSSQPVTITVAPGGASQGSQPAQGPGAGSRRPGTGASQAPASPAAPTGVR